MESDEVTKSLVDLINTSSYYKAWLDPHPKEQPGFGDGISRIYVIGPREGNVWDQNTQKELVLEGVSLKIGDRRFDLNDPQSIHEIERIFHCNINREPKFNPVEVIADFIE